MARVRPGSSERWKRRASASGADYEAGIRNPRKDWAKATAEAETNFESGIRQAVAEKRFSKGVQKAGTSKWSAKALSKGVDRYPAGVADAEDEYARGVKPYLDAIEAVSLPPRGPKGDPRNLQRVKAINDALRARKLGK